MKTKSAAEILRRRVFRITRRNQRESRRRYRLVSALGFEEELLSEREARTGIWICYPQEFS